MVTDHLVCVDICPYGTFLCYQWNWIRKSELSPIKIYTHKKLSKDTTEKIFFAKRNEGK